MPSQAKPNVTVHYKIVCCVASLYQHCFPYHVSNTVWCDYSPPWSIFSTGSQMLTTMLVIVFVTLRACLLTWSSLRPVLHQIHTTSYPPHYLCWLLLSDRWTDYQECMLNLDTWAFFSLRYMSVRTHRL